MAVYANNFSIPMGIADLVPVAFFLAASFFILRGLYNKMSKGAYALLSAGLIDVFIAGFFKAIWKILYAAGVCDFSPLNKMFFPVEALGFLLAGVAMVALLFFPQGPGKVYAIAPLPLIAILAAAEANEATAPTEYSGTMIFVVMMIIGLAFLDAGFVHICVAMKRKRYIVFFVIAFVCSLGMGYLSSKNFEKASMNWIAEGVNSVGQIALFVGSFLLYKDGLEKFVLVTRGTKKEQAKVEEKTDK